MVGQPKYLSLIHIKLELEYKIYHLCNNSLINPDVSCAGRVILLSPLD